MGNIRQFLSFVMVACGLTTLITIGVYNHKYPQLQDNSHLIEFHEYAQRSHQSFVDNPDLIRSYHHTLEEQVEMVKIYQETIEELKRCERCK